MKLKWILPIVLVLALAGVGLKIFVFNQRSVSVAAPSRREAVRAVYATGALRAERMAKLRPEVGGAIRALNVKQGEEVLQGVVVMEIDVKDEADAVIEQTSRVRESAVDLTRYQVDIDDAKANYEKEQRLLTEGATTQQAVDDAKTKLDRAQASYGKASAAVGTARTTLTTRKNRAGRGGKLTSPITGIVTKLNVNLGDNIPAGMDAIIIIDPLSFKVYADVDELDIGKIRPGQEALVAFDAIPNSRFKARVERVVPQADEITKTLRVILNLTDVPATVSDGLTATVNIINDRKQNALTIPTGALLRDSAGSDGNTAATVFVVTDKNVLESRVIEYGIRAEDYVEVLKGINESDRVALNPQASWKTGDKVEIVKNGK